MDPEFEEHTEGWLIVVLETIVDELHHQSRLADTSGGGGRRGGGVFCRV